MPYISCDEAYCEEKAYTGYDCHGDHWVPDEIPEWAAKAVSYTESRAQSCKIPDIVCADCDVICAQFDANGGRKCAK